MASFVTACRLSARLAGRKLTSDVTARGFRTSAAALAAQNFTMPALSPTMTEGNIAAWRVKEGEKFSAGDVLLEIETDKATMDVEAQEDGVLMKIFQGDGSKGVSVGTRIAVLAEEGDDISSLEIPPDEAPKQADASKQPEPQAAPATRAEKTESAPSKPATKSSGGRAPNAKYPLYPSVAQLIKENGLDTSVVKDMIATGPNGRLLKGDVLAHLGKIDASVPKEGSSRFEKLAHLDLSNIKVKAPEAKKPEPAAATPSKPAPPMQKDAVVSLPVSLAEVIKVQTKIKDTLGVFMPLSTFIDRATDVANDELPLPAGTKPSADELFNQVLGLDKVGPKSSRGSYLPQIEGLNTSFLKSQPSPKKSDIIDILSGSVPRASAPKARSSFPGIVTAENLVSLVVPQTEEKRAKVFLERLKVILEREPGRLVL